MYNPVEYFDEMNILKDDKLRRKKTAKEFINALVDFFAAQFLNLISGIFLYFLLALIHGYFPIYIILIERYH